MELWPVFLAGKPETCPTIRNRHILRHEESLKEFVYDGFCGANLSKYMIEASKLEGKTLVCLKPCDTYSFNQLIKEHRVDREKAYIIGVGCKGKLDIEKIRKTGIKGITEYQRCPA